MDVAAYCGLMSLNLNPEHTVVNIPSPRSTPAQDVEHTTPAAQCQCLPFPMYLGLEVEQFAE
jgi:hypothetical protein